jgi:hypothetical protein
MLKETEKFQKCQSKNWIKIMVQRLRKYSRKKERTNVN